MKKLLAIILATVMVAAMLPAGIVSAADTLATYNYVFSGDAHGATKALTSGDDYTQAQTLTLDDTDTSVSSGRWGLEVADTAAGGYTDTRYAESGHNSYSMTLRGVWRDFAYIRFSSGSGTSSNFWGGSNAIPTIDYLPETSYYPMVMIPLEVAKSGTFVPSIQSSQQETGVIWETYLVNMSDVAEGATVRDVFNAATSADRLGILDTYATAEKTFAPVDLKKGNYYLLFIANGANAAATVSSGYYEFRLYSFTLQEILGAEVVGTNTKFDLSTAAYSADTLAGATEVELVKEANLKTDTTNDLAANWNFIDTTKSGKWAFKYGYGAWLQATENGSNSDTPAKIAADGLTIGRNIFIQRMRGNGIYNANGTSNAPYFTLQIDVPYPGTYDLEVANSAMAAPSLFYNAYVLPEDANQTSNANFYTAYIRDTGLTDGKRAQKTTYFVGSRDLATAGSGKIGSFTAATAGTYYIVFEFDCDMSVLNANSSDSWTNAQSITFNSINIKYTARPAGATSPEAIAKEQQQNVDPENAEKEAVGSSTANVTVFAKDIDGNAIDYNNGIVEEITGMAVGTTKLLTAPEIDGYRFDYWARGIGENSRPVSTNPEYVFKATKGGSKFYAVYSVAGKSETCWVEFYDSNRELVERTKYDAGDTVTVPALPTSSARGEALIWASAVSDYEFDYEGGATFTAPNRAILAFVAEYDTAEASLKDVEVTVAGTTGATGAGSYKFGSTATVVAPARENGKGTKVFAYWTKGGEIVSFEKSYSFVATNDVTVTAVYQDYAPIATSVRKILVDSVAAGSNSEVFAEFIGCDGALERGFIFGEADVTLESAQYKASMKNSAAKSFSMINDVALTAKAYAIFADGVIYSK